MDNLNFDKLLVIEEEIEDDFFCNICNNLMFKNFQCANGHIYCKDCIEQIKTKNALCPECRSDLQVCSVNRYLERQINKLKVFCPNKFYNTIDYISDDKYGCKYECTINDLESHLKECKYGFVKCPNNEDCVKIRKLLLDEHLLICDHIKIECELCKEKVLKVNLKKHLLTECIKSNVECKCGIVLIREDLYDHLLTCPKELIDCLYFKLGCNKKIERCQLDEHVKNFNHHSIILKKFDQLSLELDNTKKKLNSCSHKYQGIWTICGWQKRCADTKKGDCLKLPFEIGSREFTLQLYPTGQKNIEGNVSLFIYNFSGQDIVASFSFELIGKGIKREAVGDQILDNKGRGWEDFIISSKKFTFGDQVQFAFKVKLEQPSYTFVSK